MILIEHGCKPILFCAVAVAVPVASKGGNQPFVDVDVILKEEGNHATLHSHAAGFVSLGIVIVLLFGITVHEGAERHLEAILEVAADFLHSFRADAVAE